MLLQDFKEPRTKSYSGQGGKEWYEQKGTKGKLWINLLKGNEEKCGEKSPIVLNNVPSFIPHINISVGVSLYRGAE